MEIGDKLPQITAKSIDNEEIELSQLLTQDYLLLYFYPKDNTPGCTNEACSFRDLNKEIQALGVRVVGISKDTIGSHKKFKEKHALSFELLSDTERKVLEAFDVIKKKKMFGKEVMGTKRSSFLFNKSGELVMKWEEVKNAGDHPEEVLEYLKSM